MWQRIEIAAQGIEAQVASGGADGDRLLQQENRELNESLRQLMVGKQGRGFIDCAISAYAVWSQKRAEQGLGCEGLVKVER